MAHMFHIIYVLIFAIIVVCQRAECVINGLVPDEKVNSCQNEENILNICKDNYTVSTNCAKKFFKAIFNEDASIPNVGLNCCKQLLNKEGRLCHDRFVKEITKNSL
ncbi:hypothetical protein ACFE04_004558 [Oxalis oulophora]